MLRVIFFKIYIDMGILKKSCTKIMLRIVPFTEYLYVPINAKGVDIKMLIKEIAAKGSFLKDLI